MPFSMSLEKELAFIDIMLALQFQNFVAKRKSSQVGYLRWNEFLLVVSLMTKKSSKWLLQD